MIKDMNYTNKKKKKKIFHQWRLNSTLFGEVWAISRVEPPEKCQLRDEGTQMFNDYAMTAGARMWTEVSLHDDRSKPPSDERGDVTGM